MKNILGLTLVLMSLVLINGCSKCSRDEVPPPPATSGDSMAPTDPADMETPTETEPSQPSDQDSSSPDESVD